VAREIDRGSTGAEAATVRALLQSLAHRERLTFWPASLAGRGVRLRDRLAAMPMAARVRRPADDSASAVAWRFGTAIPSGTSRGLLTYPHCPSGQSPAYPQQYTITPAAPGPSAVSPRFSIPPDRARWPRCRPASCGSSSANRTWISTASTATALSSSKTDGGARSLEVATDGRGLDLAPALGRRGARGAAPRLQEPRRFRSRSRSRLRDSPTRARVLSRALQPCEGGEVTGGSISKGSSVSSTASSPRGVSPAPVTQDLPTVIVP